MQNNLKTILFNIFWFLYVFRRDANLHSDDEEMIISNGDENGKISTQSRLKHSDSCNSDSSVTK